MKRGKVENYNCPLGKDGKDMNLKSEGNVSKH